MTRTMTPGTVINVVRFLMNVANDRQLDQNHEDYIGFLNVGEGLENSKTWKEIVAPGNRSFILHIMDQLNLATEDGFDLEETVFIKI